MLSLVKKGGVDKELDALFKSTVKRRLETEDAPKERKKRSKPDAEIAVVPVVAKAAPPPPVKKVKGKANAVVPESDSEDENPDLEDAYLGAKLAAQAVLQTSDNEQESSDGGDPSELVHESLLKRKRTKPAPKTKFVPAEETAEQRDARTIFVGNLPVTVAQQRPLLKQLQRFILAQVPSAKIESTRFRSIPFQTPTSKLPTSDDEGDATTKAKKSTSTTTPTVRQHDRDRTSTWQREHAPHLAASTDPVTYKPHTKNDDDDDAAGKHDAKQYLNDNQKKKIAFIKADFHSAADGVNAYVVFAHPTPLDANRPTNLPPPAIAMDPYEAARLARERCDGMSFMGRVIRVDRVAKNTTTTTTGDGKVTAAAGGKIDGDPKMSVFVGNLDFASKEEDLRVFFEGVVSTERGPPVADVDSGDKEEEEEETGEHSSVKPVLLKKTPTWVTRVRIVRDKETQLGKGFAYIQFRDRECVDEVLALESPKLKFAKRTLRVQRCKTLPGGTSLPASSHKNPTKLHPSARPGAHFHQQAAVVVVPKGDPTLGKKISHLPKEARKQVKSTDVDRVARRLAKKKARNALVLSGVKSGGGGAGGGNGNGKERTRERKGRDEKGSGGGAGKKKEAGKRVRSDRSVAKLNGKK